VPHVPRPIFPPVRFAALASILALAALSALAAAPATASPGALDPSFGSGGSVRMFPSEEETELRAVAAQADGKVVLAGAEPPGNVLVVRLLANGALDPSFGSGGKVSTPFPGGFGEARAVAIQPDGKIVVAGQAKGAVDGDFLVARYRGDGSPDPEFGGGDGIEVFPVGAAQDQAEAVSIGPSGRILLTGFAELPGNQKAAAVAVLRANGEPDPGFSADGLAEVKTTGAEEADSGEAIIEQPDGKILVADATGDGGGNGFTVVRLLASGEPDPGFGSGGGFARTVIPPGSGSNGSAGRITDLALLGDGRIVAAGYGYDQVGSPPHSDTKFAAVRYLESGQLDPSFGGAGIGIFTHQLGEGDDSPTALEIDPSGRPLLAGSYEASAAGGAPGLLRLTADGTLDPAYGAGGASLLGEAAPFGEAFDAAALDPEERMLTVSVAFLGAGQTEVVVRRFLGDKQPRLVNRPPHARIKKLAKKIAAVKLKRFSGTAADPDGDGVRKVQVSVVKLKQGQKASRVRPRGWRTAKGRAKWSLKLKHPLATGRYVVFARAVDGAGLAESTFSRKARNRLAFRVLP
jgi:uncharacterized delta-60 repeat protein